MLQRQHRLKKRQAFDWVYQRGRRKSGSLLTVGWIPREVDSAKQNLCPVQDPIPPTQVAVVVSRKVSRKAVERNRVRRRIRAGIRLLMPGIPAGQWIIIYTRSKTVGCRWQELLAELRHLLRKAGLFQDP